MTAERWKQVEELYHAALERRGDGRAAYLEEACGGDADLRREVESLLNQTTESGGFLEGQALEAAARSYVSTITPDLSGKILGRYEVLARIGRGGMGEVYRCRDTRLKREVALKILPPESVADPERRRRFEQEARAASALNHPNIVTIHDIDQAEGIDFIVMEYLPGSTLAERIGPKGLPLKAALNYAVQIADALMAAHAVHIVHRDLKPANVMVNDAGQVKILDFGLAKLTERPTGEAVSTATEAGTVVGTVAYMSPEQAEGKKVDTRSDIFSFGAVLYEMLTGQRAFARESTASTLAAILREEPKPPGELTPGLPQELDRILRRCLRKEPQHRFQHMDDVKVALEELAEEAVSRSRQGARKRRLVLGAVVPALVAMIAIAAWYTSGTRPQPPPRIVPLTSFPGWEACPSFSPDGDRIAFHWNGPKQDKYDIYVKQIGTENPSRLTSDANPSVVPAWSPDGLWIAFLRRLAGDKYSIFLIPSIGGPERKLAEIPGIAGLVWSPDGEWLAFAERDNPNDETGFSSSLYALSVRTGEKRRLTSAPSDAFDSVPAFSPDGRKLAFARAPNQANAFVYLIPLSTTLHPQGVPKQITFQRWWWTINGAAWAVDGREIFYAGSDDISGNEMWRVPASGGRPQKLELLGDQVGPFAISRQRNRLVFQRYQTDLDIWRVELPGPGGKPADPVNLISSTLSDLVPRYSPDGERIVFTSGRSGNQEVWVCGKNGAEPVQLTSMHAVAGSPAWSPDGKRIVFCSTARGNWDLHTISAEGGKPLPLTTHPADDAVGSFSRDGRWMYFTSSRTGRFEMWKMPAGGGEPVQLTRNGGWIGRASPDGKYLYYAPSTGLSSLRRVLLGGGPEEKVLEPIIGASFAVTSKGIYFARPRPPGGGTPIEFFDFANGKTTPVTTTPRAIYWSLAVSPDERYLLYSQYEPKGSDLMLVENFR